MRSVKKALESLKRNFHTLRAARRRIILNSIVEETDDCGSLI